MKTYFVQLVEAEYVGITGDDKIIFECDAYDFDHAIEQALDAYPDADITECVEGE